MEASEIATSNIPTLATAMTGATDGFPKIKTPYPAQLDLFGAAVTRSNIGMLLASGESTGMARLGMYGGGLREWEVSSSSYLNTRILSASFFD
jgi:hypothetical protein